MAAPAFPVPTLVGPTLRLRPLAAHDADRLYGVAADPEIWAQHPDRLRWQRPVFDTFFAGALASGSAVAVEALDTGALLGSSRWYDWEPAARSVAIGYTFLARSHWGGATNGELKRLMLDHAFTQVDTVWFHIGRDNWRSRKALEKIGGRLSHEGPREHGGVMHPYTFYRIDRAEWVARGAS